MNSKNISLFLVITFLFSHEVFAMSSIAQRLGFRTGRVTRRTSQVAQPKASGGFSSWLSKNLSWNSWFGSNVGQKRYFSAKNIPSAQSSLLLVEAVKSGSKEKLHELIKKGLVDIKARYDNNETILHIAVKYDVSPEIIALLIDVGADVHAKDIYGYTPLHTAAEKGKVEAVKLLVFKGANPNATTANDSEKGMNVLLRYLNKSSKGKSPLYLAQEEDKPSKNTIEIIKFLEPLTDKSLWFVVTPERALWRAVLLNKIAELKRLLAEHAFSKELLSDMLLRGAKESEVKPEILAILIDAGADVNAQDASGRTPLHGAVDYNNLAAVKLLLSKGANPNMLDYKGKTPLDLANGNWWQNRDTVEIIKILELLTTKLKKQYETSARLGDESLLLLQKAVAAVDSAAVKQILAEYTFSKSVLNEELIKASRGWNPERADILAALIDAGANVNTQDILWKRTALHHAANYANPAAVKLLLNRKANPDMVDSNSRAPLYIVQEKDMPSEETETIIKLLEPVTKKSLWFVVTPEVLLRRAVKGNKINEVRSALELEQDRAAEAKEAKESTQHAKKRTKRFVKGDKEQLLKALQNAASKKPVYEVLGLDKNNSEEEIDAAYREWVINHHPDLYRDEILKKQATAVLQYLNQYLR